VDRFDCGSYSDSMLFCPVGIYSHSRKASTSRDSQTKSWDKPNRTLNKKFVYLRFITYTQVNIVYIKRVRLICIKDERGNYH
jgi:hypothetical protein